MEASPTAETIQAVRIVASTSTSAPASIWNDIDQSWTREGGIEDLSDQLRALAKANPVKALEVFEALVNEGHTSPVAWAFNELSKTSISDDAIFDFVRRIRGAIPVSDALGSETGSLLYHRCQESRGLPDDLCQILCEWLDAYAERRGEHEDLPFSQSEDEKKKSPSSVLWTSELGLINAGKAFWPLLALTYGYIMRNPPHVSDWLERLEKHVRQSLSQETWGSYCLELRWSSLDPNCDERGEELVKTLFARFPRLMAGDQGARLVGFLCGHLSVEFVKSFMKVRRSAERNRSRQAYGELLTLIAFREATRHPWARELLIEELSISEPPDTMREPILCGIGFAAAQLWELPEHKAEAARILSGLIPNATNDIGIAISTTFWASTDFVDDEPTKELLAALSRHPLRLSRGFFADLIEHLVPLTAHNRNLVLNVCQALLRMNGPDSDLYIAGPHLVSIAMTLQRFSDSRDGGLALFEELLKLGLDEAYKTLRDIDLQSSAVATREPPRRRRRRRQGSSTS